MSTFSDDFERPDGGVGNGWIVASGACAIASGRVSGTTGSKLYQQSLSATGRQEIVATVYLSADGSLSSGIYLKLDTSTLSGYVIYGSGTLASPSWLFRRTNGTSFATLATIGGSGLSVGAHTYRVVYEAGIIRFWVDGAYIGLVGDGTYSANAGAGWYWAGANSALNAFSFYGDESVTFTVDPSPIGNFGDPTELTFTGVGTSWTAGTPGSPTFTVDHGTLSGQVVSSTTSATATYDPGTFLGMATFADPSTGATCQVEVTSNPDAMPTGEACPFNQDFIDMANSTGTLDTPGTLLTTSDIVVVSPVLNITDALNYLIVLVRNLYNPAPDWPGGASPSDVRLDLIWNAINGGVEQPVGLWSPTTDQPVKLDTEETLAALKALTSDGDYNLARIISDIAGTGGYNLTTLLANIPATDLTPVLDALAAIRGDTTTSLYTLLSAIADMRTVNSWSLGDVKDWIDAIPGGGGGGLTLGDKAFITGEHGAILLAIAGVAEAVATDVAADLGEVISIAGMVAQAAADLAVLLQAIADLKNTLAGVKPSLTPPIWPGESYVDWGEEIAIESNLPVVGDMHGVVVSITGCEGGTRLFDYDGITNYSHLGALAFCSDRGDQEPFQPLGPSRGIYTVKTMARASACRLYRSRNVRGTIQPWKQKPGI